MALNFKNVKEVSQIPSRVRGAASDSEREEVYKEFFTLIDMAKSSKDGMVAVRIEGEAECNKYSNALQSFKSAHPHDWACLNTAGGTYERDSQGRPSKMIATTLYAAARPHERKLAKLA